MRHRERNSIRNDSTPWPESAVQILDLNERYENGVLVETYGSGGNEPFVTGTGVGSHEIMEDMKSVGASRMNPCDHSKLATEMPGWTNTQVKIFGEEETGNFTRVTRTSSLVENRCAGIPASGIHIPPFSRVLRDDPRMLSAAIRHMTNCMDPVKESISIANFILELDDVQKVQLSFSQTWKEIRKFVLSHNPSTWRNWKGLFVESSLAYNFGWKPLIGDLRTLWNTASNAYATADRLKKLQSSRGVTVNTRDSITDRSRSYTTLVVPGAWSEGYGAFYRTGFVVEPSTIDICLTSSITADSRHVDSYQANLLGLMKAWGVTNPARIVWNAIPYSFVLDYVFNVSDMFRRIDLMYPFLGMHIGDSCCSFKQSQSVIAYVHRVLNANTLSNPLGFDDCWFRQQEDSRVTRSLFQRFRGLPQMDGQLMNWPTFRELMLSIALAAQRISDGSSPKINWSNSI